MRHETHTVIIANGHKRICAYGQAIEEPLMTEILIKILDMLVGGIIAKRRKREAVSDEFEALRREVMHEAIMNNIPAKLKQVRSFLIVKGLVEHAEFREFYSKWLTDPVVEMGIPVINVYSTEKLNELRKEIASLQI